MTNVLVTGGNGFLGKHVCQKFKQYNNLNIFAPTSKELDLLDLKQVSDYIKNNNINTILHMAALCGGILANKNSPADFITSNSIMGMNVYQAAAQLKKDIKIYSLGSVCMYPKFCPTPFREDDIWNGFPEETNAPYGQSKRTLLMLSQTYRKQYNIKGGFFIPVNLYGPNDHFDLINSHVIPALINKFVDAKEKMLSYACCWGTGEATREFLYVEDAAEVLTKTVASELDFSEPINIGSGDDISIKDLALLIKKLVEYEGEVIFDGSVSDGQPKRMLDVSRAKKILKWQSSTSLEEGLIKTINWYKNNK